MRAVEDGAIAVDDDFALLPICADDVLAEDTVKVDAEFFGDDVEVIEVGEGGVILHDHEHAAGFDPLRDLCRIFSVGKVRMRILVEIVR